jgi:hypothetical protein
VHDVNGIPRSALLASCHDVAPRQRPRGVRFPAMDNPPPGYITHIKVDRIAGVGPWATQH